MLNPRSLIIAGPMVGHAGFNLLQVVKFLTWGG